MTTPLPLSWQALKTVSYFTRTVINEVQCLTVFTISILGVNYILPDTVTVRGILQNWCEAPSRSMVKL